MLLFQALLDWFVPFRNRQSFFRNIWNEKAKARKALA
jgi:hypothetical protein